MNAHTARRALADAEKAHAEIVADRQAVEQRLQAAEKRVQELERRLEDEFGKWVMRGRGGGTRRARDAEGGHLLLRLQMRTGSDLEDG